MSEHLGLAGSLSCSYSLIILSKRFSCTIPSSTCLETSSDFFPHSSTSDGNARLVAILKIFLVVHYRRRGEGIAAQVRGDTDFTRI